MKKTLSILLVVGVIVMAFGLAVYAYVYPFSHAMLCY